MDLESAYDSIMKEITKRLKKQFIILKDSQQTAEVKTSLLVIYTSSKESFDKQLFLPIFLVSCRYAFTFNLVPSNKAMHCINSANNCFQWDWPELGTFYIKFKKQTRVDVYYIVVKYNWKMTKIWQFSTSMSRSKCTLCNIYLDTGDVSLEPFILLAVQDDRVCIHVFVWCLRQSFNCWSWITFMPFGCAKIISYKENKRTGHQFQTIKKPHCPISIGIRKRIHIFHIINYEPYHLRK